MRKIKRFLSALLCGAILITGTLAGVSVRTDAAASSYAVQLRAAGFPDSYIRALSALHTAYPQWQFQAVKTGLDWNTVVSKESVNGVNLVPKTGNDATKSTADGAYDWTTNVWTVYDGSSWVGADADYIAYYLDPRNFLNETDIFQFESLSFSKVQTKQGVSSILKGTFMENTVEDSDGSALDYAQAFMDIGEETGVSPYHLASRVRQEQGLKGTSSLISGTYSGYEGYYNYFNVGAAGITSTLVIKNGLAYAKKAGWNTRYAALEGGAKILAKNYIGVGQDTLYFQKFNVVNQKNLYSHQYMANLAAAYNEGRKLGQGYADKQQAFVFRIPVYSGMPASAVTFTASGNPNNYLKSLSVTGQTLTPVFRGDTTSYSLVVDSKVSTVTISASPVAAKSSVTGTGTKKLQTGTNTCKVTCKSESGASKTYTLTIVKKAGAAAETEKTSVTSKTYQLKNKMVMGIAPGTKAATFLKKFKVTAGTVKLFSASKKSVIGIVSTGNVLQVYDSKNKKVSSYTLVIYGDVNGDGKINKTDLNRLNRHLNGTQKLTGCYLKAADTNRKKDGVNVLDLVYLNKHLQGKITIQQ